MTEEDRVEVTKLNERLAEINKQIQEIKKSNPNFYPNHLIEELSQINIKIMEYGINQ